MGIGHRASLFCSKAYPRHRGDCDYGFEIRRVLTMRPATHEWPFAVSVVAGGSKSATCRAFQISGATFALIASRMQHHVQVGIAL